jgi:hypothetical protein
MVDIFKLVKVKVRRRSLGVGGSDKGPFTRWRIQSVVPATQSQRTLSHELSTTKSLLHLHLPPSSISFSSTCKRLVSNGHAPHRRICDSDAHDCSAEEPTSKAHLKYSGSTS